MRLAHCLAIVGTIFSSTMPVYSFQDPPEAKSAAELVSSSSISLQSKDQTPGCLSSLTKSLEGKTKKSLDLLGGISLIIGTMIGSGIFASATTVARLSGSVGMYLMTWVLTGLIATLGALSYAELGTMIAVSGGEYSYLHTGFGPVVAFMFSWVSILILRPSSLSAISLACGNYLVEPFYPSLSECIPELVSKEELAKLIAAFVLGECLCVSC